MLSFVAKQQKAGTWAMSNVFAQVVGCIRYSADYKAEQRNPIMWRYGESLCRLTGLWPGSVCLSVCFSVCYITVGEKGQVRCHHLTVWFNHDMSGGNSVAEDTLKHTLCKCANHNNNITPSPIATGFLDDVRV